MMLPRLIASPLTILLVLIGVAQASFPEYHAVASNASYSQEPRPGIFSDNLRKRQDPPVNETFYLRICPLGASITNGYESSDGNGYRKHLRDQLRWSGWAVNMVGSLDSGTMNNNQNEGHIGLRIDEVSSQFLQNLQTYQPNLVLINLGTNDARQNYEVSTAGQRMIQLLEQLWLDVPGATVISSTLIPNTDPQANANVQSINQQYTTTVMNHYSRLGKKLLLCNMNDGFITTADLNPTDGTHPTDEGYTKMASVWWSAFQKLENLNWLTQAPNTGVPDSATGYDCPKVYGHGSAVTQIQVGSGYDDGPYVHASVDQGQVFTFPFLNAGNGPDGNFNLNAVFCAELVDVSGNPDRSAAADEIIYVLDSGSGTYTYSYWANLENNNFGPETKFNPQQACPPARVRFADINNDGLDDFICLDENGDLYMSLNIGGTPPQFEYIGLIGTAPAGYTYDLVRLADMDGDGRVDYCLIDPSSNIICQRNGGVGTTTAPTTEYGGYWQDFSTGGTSWTTMFPTQGEVNAAGVNMVDLNGDFKADWLYMDETGQVETFINNRGGGSDGMVPNWQYDAITHHGLASFGVTDANSRVKFGRMYGTGRRDYIWTVPTRLASGAWSHSLHIWKNEGAGGTYLKGDGSNYCDMDGDDYADYIWVGPTGSIDIYINIKDAPHWSNHIGVTNLNLPRKGIRIADLDGDGKCDLLYVDPTTGAVQMWHNQYIGTWSSSSFVYLGLVSPATMCTAAEGGGNGVGENDLGVRFADLTGNGRSDYLCLLQDSQVTSYLNDGLKDGAVGWNNVGQIKFETGYDRANVRFNDVNGDGLADLLWINKYDGDTTVYYNAGEIPTSGSAFMWVNQGALYEGWDRGANMHFAPLSGEGRADTIDVIPSTNIAYVSYNTCPGDRPDGDDAVMGNPNLPAYIPKSPLVWV